MSGEHALPGLRYRSYCRAVGHDLPSFLDIPEGTVRASYAHVSPCADEENFAFDFILGGDDAGGGEELLVRGHGKGRVDGVKKDRDAGNEMEAALRKTDGPGVIFLVESDLSGARGGGNVNLRGSPVAGEANVVHSSAVHNQM